MIEFFGSLLDSDKIGLFRRAAQRLTQLTLVALVLQSFFASTLKAQPTVFVDPCANNPKYAENVWQLTVDYSNAVAIRNLREILLTASLPGFGIVIKENLKITATTDLVLYLTFNPYVYSNDPKIGEQVKLAVLFKELVLLGKKSDFSCVDIANVKKVVTPATTTALPASNPTEQDGGVTGCNNLCVQGSVLGNGNCEIIDPGKFNPDDDWFKKHFKQY